MKRPIGIAHRGFSGIAPENTLVSFEKALACKPDAVECDVHLSRDGYLMVIHDDTVDRTTNGKGKIAEMDYQELRLLDAGSWFSDIYRGEKIPVLEEVLDLVKGKTGICIELKGPDTAEKTIQMIEKMKMADRVSLFSFQDREIKIAKMIQPSIPTLFLRWYDPDKPLSMTWDDLADEIISLKANMLGINKEMVNPELIDIMHSKSILIGVYTVNQENQMDQLINLGIDGLVSDFPDRLMGKLVS